MAFSLKKVVVVGKTLLVDVASNFVSGVHGEVLITVSSEVEEFVLTFVVLVTEKGEGCGVVVAEFVNTSGTSEVVCSFVVGKAELNSRLSVVVLVVKYFESPVFVLFTVGVDCETSSSGGSVTSSSAASNSSVLLSKAE